MKKIALFTLAGLLSACASVNPDVSGTYKGTLTCADCEKIEAELILNNDQTYQYNTVYHFAKKRAQMFNESGSFTYSSEPKGFIYLQNSVNLPLQINRDYLEFYDENGRPTHGDSNYKLFKVVPTAE